MSERPLVAIYADESCLGNGREGDNPGGAGGLVEWKNREPATSCCAITDLRAATTNIAGIRSAIEALRAISSKASHSTSSSRATRNIS